MFVAYNSFITILYVVMAQARHRRRHDPDLDDFVFPYDLGCRRNFSQVINWSLRERGDGIHWEVEEDCFEYALTVSGVNIQ